MFRKVLEQVIKCFRDAITKKPLFLPENGQEMPFFGLKQCFWGPSPQVLGPLPFFQGAGPTKNVLQGVRAIHQGFRSRNCQKNDFFAQKRPKRPCFGLKQCFWGLSGEL